MSILEQFPKKLTPRDVQKNALLELEKRIDDANILVVNLPVASGKCLRKGTEILMFSGERKKVEDILPGELVMGPDSLPRKVLNTCNGVTDLYTIIPKRGESYTVTHNHILSIKVSKEVEEISITEFLKKSKTYKTTAKQYQATISYPTKELKVDPYIFGLWLGDGDSCNTCLTSADQILADIWQAEGYARGLDCRIEMCSGKANRYFIKTKGQRTAKNKNTLKQDIGSYGVFYNKHIPQEYLTSDRQQRLKLLAGIIDTDGYVNQKNRTITFGLCNERLTNDIITLARSLGFSANRQKNKTINKINYYRCHISGLSVEEIPTRLTRKKPVNSISDQRNSCFKVEYAGKGEYAGIEVDGDNLYVLGNFVVTHNSAIAMTIAHWRKKCSIITPTKLLVEQYKNEYNYIHVLRAKSDYWCDTFKCPLNKRPKVKKLGATCKAALGCSGCKSYLSDLRKARVMPYLLSNYYIYLAHALYRDTLVIDEAHNLIDVLKQMSAKKLWSFKHKFPHNLRTRDDVKYWINNLDDYMFQNADLKFLRDEINSYRPRFLITVGEEMYHGESYRCIKMLPLDISDAPPVMWPNQVKKIVLLSATISRKDIEQLGLAGKKVQYIQADSPIQAERRPVIFPRENKSMAFRSQDENLKHLVNFIEETAMQNEGKGLIHATYSLANKLKNVNWSPEIKDRLIFHNRTNKAQMYNEFRAAEEGKILVASGMYEGIDLPYDAGRWQVLAKIPWPSLADPAIKFLCDEDDEWYAWETIKTVLQACGRICRTPEDYGVTYIFDSTFKRLYNNNNSLFPKWFKNSVKGI